MTDAPMTDPRQTLCDLMDGRLQGEPLHQAISQACASDSSGDAARADWHAWHVAGDVLRSADLAACRHGAAFTARVMQRIGQEVQPPIAATALPPARPMTAAGSWRRAWLRLPPQPPSAGTSGACPAAPPARNWRKPRLRHKLPHKLPPLLRPPPRPPTPSARRKAPCCATAVWTSFWPPIARPLALQHWARRKAFCATPPLWMAARQAADFRQAA